ncbi:MAG: hypothetical protein ACLP70_19335, partial [Streptosporangiaceae bacterium]
MTEAAGQPPGLTSQDAAGSRRAAPRLSTRAREPAGPALMRAAGIRELGGPVQLLELPGPRG